MVTTDPIVAELARRLLSDDNEVLAAALFETRQLLDLWSESWRTEIPARLEGEEARALVRSSLVECIDRDPTRPVAVTLIFVLGKLYDSSLEPYFAKLATLFVQEDRLSSHLYQVMIALDNLELIPELQISDEPNSISTIRRIITEYLQAHSSKHD